MKFFFNIKDFFFPKYEPTTRLEMLAKKLGQALYERQQEKMKRFKKAQDFEKSIAISEVRVEQDCTKKA